MPTASVNSGDGASAPSRSDPTTAGRGAGIAFDAVTVAYRGSVVLDRLSLEIHEGEIIGLIGPSGSGKTTALRAVAGFTRPASGRIRIGDLDVTDLPPYKRGIGMVVQNYALFPHMRVEDNVAFGLRARGASRNLIRKRVAECLQLVGMSAFLGRYPRQLSGGQQQRIAIARALAIEPRVLLLDEPLSALDAQIRRSMVEEIAKLHHDLPHLTVIYVTHDQSEALTLADRIAIMRDGKLSSVGVSQSLYRHPPNRFTAEFLGNANLLPVQIARESEVVFNGKVLHVSDRSAVSEGDALLCVRPHALKLSDPNSGNDTANVLSGELQSVVWQGDHQSLRVNCAGTPVRVVVPPLVAPPKTGAMLNFRFDPEDATVVPFEQV
jgi:2-aminoethylphosphonate transport system ATP-binding protein